MMIGACLHEGVLPELQQSEQICLLPYVTARKQSRSGEGFTGFSLLHGKDHLNMIPEAPFFVRASQPNGRVLT